MTALCPKCHRPIPTDDINVATDVALCRACHLVHPFSGLMQAAALQQGVDFGSPPPGVYYRSSSLGAVITATHRSLGTAVGMLAAALFWNGIVSMFLLLVVSSTLQLLHINVPAWFPPVKVNQSEMGAGMTVFLWVFLTPFILVGLGLIFACLNALCGRTEVTVRPGEGVIRTGPPLVRWRKRFNPQFVKDVGVEDKRWMDSDGDRRGNRQILIEMQDGNPIKFGSSLRPERMKFVAAALRKAVLS